MQIEIQARNFSVTKALSNYIKRRLNYALGSRDDYIQRVMVRLSDINGPRGGADKCCHLQVMLARQSDVVIENTEVDLYNAIDRATRRAGHTLTRRLTRRRQKGRALSSASKATIEI